jgi:hypothetical protein
VQPFPFGETVTITRQTDNAYGDWSAGDTHTIEGCAVWPTTGTETVAGGMDIVVFGLTLLMPPGSDVLSTDTVIVRDTSYNVNGEPTFYKSPLTGTRGGLEVQLKAITG